MAITILADITGKEQLSIDLLFYDESKGKIREVFEDLSNEMHKMSHQWPKQWKIFLICYNVRFQETS